MDSGDGVTLTSRRTTPLEGTTTLRINPSPAPFDLVGNIQHSADPRHTMGADQIPPTSRTVDDMLRKPKKARLHQEVRIVKRPPHLRRNASKAWWFKAQHQEEDSSMCQISEEDSEWKKHGRYLAQIIRDLKNGVKKLDVETKDEKPVEVVHTSDAGNVDHLPKIPSQQEQAKPPEGPPRSSKEYVPYSMPEEYYDKLDKRARFCFARWRVVSRKETIAKGFKCVTEEASLAFRNYLAEKDVSEGSDHKFGEVLHHCFGAEYRKVYCHYNFTVEIKKNDEACWNSMLFFAEAKLVNGVKTYFCCPLQVTDDGPCYSCKSQFMTDVKHPAEGDYEKVHEPTFIYLDDEDDPDNYELV